MSWVLPLTEISLLSAYFSGHHLIRHQGIDLQPSLSGMGIDLALSFMSSREPQIKINALHAKTTPLLTRDLCQTTAVPVD